MKEISNIKISCVFQLPTNWRLLLNYIVNKRKIKIKKTANITVIKDKYIFCIFEKKDKTVHFNVTKIKSISDIFNFLFFFSQNYFSYNTTLLSLKVDNITSSFNIKKPILFKQLKLTNQKFNFNPERFSGFFIKYTEGTAVLFQSGKINIIGCKTVTAIQKIWKDILMILPMNVNI